MEYNDDGLTLNYDLLKTTFPSKRGWNKFLNNRPSHAPKEDYVYYGKHRGAVKSFNPPVITDSINLTNKSLLTPALDVEAEYKLEQVRLQNSKVNYPRITHALSNGLSKNTNTSMVKNGWTKEADGFNSENSSPRGSNNHQNDPGSEEDRIGRDVTESKVLSKKIAKGEKPGKKRNNKAGKLFKKSAEEPKSLLGQGLESKESGSEGKYLKNRIPSFSEEYDNQNMYSINRRFYFNPINPSLQTTFSKDLV